MPREPLWASAPRLEASGPLLVSLLEDFFPNFFQLRSPEKKTQLIPDTYVTKPFNLSKHFSKLRFSQREGTHELWLFCKGGCFNSTSELLPRFSSSLPPGNSKSSKSKQHQQTKRTKSTHKKVKIKKARTDLKHGGSCYPAIGQGTKATKDIDQQLLACQTEDPQPPLIRWKKGLGQSLSWTEDKRRQGV